MGHLKITPDMVSVTAVFVGYDDGEHVLVSELAGDLLIHEVKNVLEHASEVYSCLDDIDVPLVRVFTENYNKVMGYVFFTHQSVRDVSLSISPFDERVELMSVSLLQLPQDTSAVYMETYGVFDKVKTTANPFYTDDLNGLTLNITRYVVANGSKAFEKTLYIHGDVLDSRWSISEKPILGNDFVVTILANQRVDNLSIIQVPDSALTYRSISFWGADGEEIPPIDSWFEGTPLEQSVQMNEMLCAFIFEHGLYGVVQMDFEDGRGEIGVCYKLL